MDYKEAVSRWGV